MTNFGIFVHERLVNVLLPSSENTRLIFHLLKTLNSSYHVYRISHQKFTSFTHFALSSLLTLHVVVYFAKKDLPWCNFYLIGLTTRSVRCTQTPQPETGKNEGHLVTGHHSYHKHDDCRGIHRCSQKCLSKGTRDARVQKIQQQNVSCSEALVCIHRI